MAIRAEIEIFDTLNGDFPEESERVCFIWDDTVYTGYPFINRMESSKSGQFHVNLSRAKKSPLKVSWGGSDDRIYGFFRDVRYWFRVPLT